MFVFINLKKNKYKKKINPPFYQGGLGGACDCFGSGLQTFALFFVPPSIYSIAKNATVIFTAMFSVLYLKKSLYRHQIFSIIIIMIGFIMVALASIIYDKPADSDHKHDGFNFMSIIGMLSLFISLLFQGFVFTYQEKLLDNYELNPLQMVGMESMMGAIMCTFLLMITSNITCTHPEFCNAEIGQPIDSPPTSLYDLGVNYAWVYFFLTAISIMIFNFVGLIITKYAGSVFRVILDTLRTITIWIISVIIGFEKLKPFNKIIIELVGFAFLIVGNLIYNEIIVIKICGLDKFIKKNREANENENSNKDSKYEKLLNEDIKEE